MEFIRPDKERRLAASWLLTAWMALGAAACSDTDSSPDAGVSQDPDAGLDHLDLNGDGALTAADVEPGQAAVYWTHTPREGEPKTYRERTSEARFFHDGGSRRWALRVEVSRPGSEGANVHIWFPTVGSEPPELTPSAIAVELVSIDIPSVENGGHIDSALADLGTITIEEATAESASGHWSGDVTTPVLDYMTHEKTRERFSFRAVAFHSTPAPSHADGDDLESDDQ